MSEVSAKDKAKLFAKLAKIMKEVGEVKKTGKNTQQGYKYVTEVDILNAVRDKLAEANIFVFTSVEEQTFDLGHKIGNRDNIILTKVKTAHTFACGETGATFTVYSQGQGTDSMDKGVFKAITGAVKYFFSKSFLIGTEDDPEADSGNLQSAKAKVNKAAAVKAVANKPAASRPATSSGFGTKKEPVSKSSGFGTPKVQQAAASTPAVVGNTVPDPEF